MTLWLNNCGLYDRKATESSNGAVQPSSHGALDLLSCSRRLEMGKGSRTTDREKGPASVSEVWREGVAHPLGQVAPCARKVHVPQEQSSKLRRECTPSQQKKVPVERHGKTGAMSYSKIASIFDHTARNSSIIKSNYHQAKALAHGSPLVGAALAVCALTHKNVRLAHVHFW